MFIIIINLFCFCHPSVVKCTPHVALPMLLPQRIHEREQAGAETILDLFTITLHSTELSHTSVVREDFRLLNSTQSVESPRLGGNLSPQRPVRCSAASIAAARCRTCVEPVRKPINHQWLQHHIICGTNSIRLHEPIRQLYHACPISEKATRIR